MSKLVCAFEEFKEQNKIQYFIIPWKRKNDEFILVIICLQKNFNLEKENSRLKKLLSKPGLWWYKYWDIDFAVEN